MTGAELKVWRERLGKDEAWIEEALDRLDLIAPPGCGYGSERRRNAEGCSQYTADTTAVIRTAYRAALEAEEARQAAERAQAEPVCPEGVDLFRSVGHTWVRPSAHFSGGIGVMDDGTMRESGLAEGYVGLSITPACLRYAADLSEYRARKHAEGDRQRKLDAVRAAEAAQREATTAYHAARGVMNDAVNACNAASSKLTAAAGALVAARREAGL